MATKHFRQKGKHRKIKIYIDQILSDVASSYISCIQFIRFSIHIVVISNTSCFKQQPAHITIIDCFVSNIFCTQYEASKEELIVQYPNEGDIHDFNNMN